MLKSEFAGYTPVERPVINYDNVILDPYWISGFVSAEGNFDVRMPSTPPYRRRGVLRDLPS